MAVYMRPVVQRYPENEGGNPPRLPQTVAERGL